MEPHAVLELQNCMEPQTKKNVVPRRFQELHGSYGTARPKNMRFLGTAWNRTPTKNAIPMRFHVKQVYSGIGLGRKFGLWAFEFQLFLVFGIRC